jgi:hypothetical protein
MIGRISRSVSLNAQAGYAATCPTRSFVVGFSKSRQYQNFSTSALSTNPEPAISGSKPAASTCGSVQNEATPVIGKGLEQKTIDDLKDMHVEAVDDVDEPFAWKNPNTGYSLLILVCIGELTNKNLQGKSAGLKDTCEMLNQQDMEIGR